MALEYIPAQVPNDGQVTAETREGDTPCQPFPCPVSTHKAPRVRQRQDRRCTEDGKWQCSAIECLHDLPQGRIRTVITVLNLFPTPSAIVSLQEEVHSNTSPSQCQSATLSQSARMSRQVCSHLKRELDRCRKLAHDPSSRRSILWDLRPLQ